MSIISVLALTFGVLMGMASLPQAYKIFKRKSAKDISIITYGILLIGAIVWILYGLEKNDSPIIITNILGAISVGLVVIGWFFYGRLLKKTKKR